MMIEIFNDLVKSEVFQLIVLVGSNGLTYWASRLKDKNAHDVAILEVQNEFIDRVNREREYLSGRINDIQTEMENLRQENFNLKLSQVESEKREAKYVARINQLEEVNAALTVKITQLENNNNG